MTPLAGRRRPRAATQRSVLGIPADPRPALLGLGTAVPGPPRDQAVMAEMLIDLCGLAEPAAERVRRIAASSGIKSRHVAVEPEEVIDLGTGARMQRYEALAPELATAAARRALTSSGVNPGQVTDLIVVSCTGFSAPGLDVQLIRSLDLQSSAHRTMIGYMGCYGGIIGVRAAAAACGSGARRVALVVCLELCSLHVRRDSGLQNQIASLLFADGAAAAVVGSAGRGRTGEQSVSLGRIGQSRSRLVAHSTEHMSWRMTDAGFAMTLSREVPALLRASLASSFDRGESPRPSSFVIHPGGPEILSAADEALHLRGGKGLHASRAVLERFGNMSSGTVLVVLAEALRCGEPLPALLMAFGPGLSIESIALDPDPAPTGQGVRIR